MKKILLIACVLGLSACANNTKKEIAHEKAQVEIDCTSVNSKMREKMQNLFDNSSKLSEKQKDQFTQMHVDTAQKMCELNNEIQKLKIVLIDNLANEKYDTKKVSLITREIKSLNGKKMDLMFDNLEKARSILGVEARHFFSDRTFIDFHNMY
jgi:uncharacterized membrane protein